MPYLMDSLDGKGDMKHITVMTFLVEVSPTGLLVCRSSRRKGMEPSSRFRKELQDSVSALQALSERKVSHCNFSKRLVHPTFQGLLQVGVAGRWDRCAMSTGQGAARVSMDSNVLMQSPGSTWRKRIGAFLFLFFVFVFNVTSNWFTYITQACRDPWIHCFILQITFFQT